MEGIVFVAEKIVLRLLFPVSLSLILGGIGLALRRRRRLSFCFLSAGLLWLLVMSFPLTGITLIRSLEATAGPYADPGKLASRGVRYVVLLSGGFREGDLTPADRTGCSILRIHEAVRLWRGISDAKIVFTGGVIPGLNESVSLARAMADVAGPMGVPQSAMILETESWTTEDQARLVARIVGKEPFALVTSAYHMPRSLLLFRLQGLDPLPAPADFTVRAPIIGYETLIPQASGLQMTQIAMKEYLFMWWFRIRRTVLHSELHSSLPMRRSAACPKRCTGPVPRMTEDLLGHVRTPSLWRKNVVIG
jgi:uncharacterized SAM-binding protein YcdF (DUF218 family)